MIDQDKTYISLQEATKFCNYSQEYLSLRARRGKLKAVKFGRNWVTTKEWLQDYVEGVKEYSEVVKNKSLNKPKTHPLLITTLAFIILMMIIGGQGIDSFQMIGQKSNSLGQAALSFLDNTFYASLVAARNISTPHILKDYIQWLKNGFTKEPQREIEMIDKFSGDVYCVWVEEGLWHKSKGHCSK